MKSLATFFLCMAIGQPLWIVSLIAQSTLVVQPGEPVLDGVISPGEWTSSSLATARGVTLQAMADGEYFYLAASWQDQTENVMRNHLTYNGSRWSASEDEDRIAFLFDMGQSGGDGANCQAFCHFPGMHTNGGRVDVWNWKASRTNPMGYSEDTYWDEVGQQVDDGVSTILVNDLNALRIPTYMASNDPGAIRSFLVENAGAMDAFDPFDTQSTHTVDQAVAFDDTVPFSADDYIPGYVLRIPSGEIADVRAAGKYENGRWTVEFKRAFAGGEFDFEVVPGNTINFSHEIFDNQGNDHAIDGTPIDTTVYSLDFSMISATSIEPVTEETPSNFNLERNYPNPFNPSTTIEFSIPRQGFVKLEVMNVLGQVVETLVDEEVYPGHYRIEFNARSLPSGIYYYRLHNAHFSQIHQMTLIK